MLCFQGPQGTLSGDADYTDLYRFTIQESWVGLYLYLYHLYLAIYSVYG